MATESESSNTSYRVLKSLKLAPVFAQSNVLIPVSKEMGSTSFRLSYRHTPVHPFEYPSKGGRLLTPSGLLYIGPIVTQKDNPSTGSTLIRRRIRCPNLGLGR